MSSIVSPWARHQAKVLDLECHVRRYCGPRTVDVHISYRTVLGSGEIITFRKMEVKERFEGRELGFMK
jgi:hypothetical protein